MILLSSLKNAGYEKRITSVTENKWAQETALGRNRKKKRVSCSIFDLEGLFHK